MSAPTTRPAEKPGIDAPAPTPGNGSPAPAGKAADRGAGRTVAPYQLTGAESVVRSLEELDVDTIFGIPGGAVLPVYDPLFDSKKLRHVLVRHEQGAGHAASGYAHATGRVGVMMATSGPGAANLVTPLADAQRDSIPVVAITGQVGRGLIGTDAFQEADISGITMPITKHNFLVNNGDDIPRVLAEAFHIAASGRPEAAMWNASASTRGMSSPLLTRKLCLVIGMVMPEMSASWNASVPIRPRPTCPVIATTGMESLWASASGVTRFAAPGPEVAIMTPTRPVACA